MKSRSLLTACVFGTTALFGASARGQQYEVLHHFHPKPANPNGLIQASDGNFYGTTSQSGTSGAGTVFKMDGSGALTTLHSFTGPDGVRPLAALVQGSDGNFYGATNFGGASGLGTVFKITPSGALTTLHSFAGSDGKSPQFGRWIQASDGSFYGTTIQGGASGVGTIFKITPSGTLTTLHSFAGSAVSGGSYPSAGLIQGSDGNFYGTAALGGASGVGTVFKMTPSGTVTTLHSFAGSNGSYPQAELIEGSDGSFYGTTPFGGVANNAINRGTVFKITPAGTFTSLHSFATIEGANPQAGLIKGSDGNFYGTTIQGGTSSLGTVFEMDFSGNVATLRSFAGSDGANPSAGVIQASDGNFYGTTNQGGAEDDGTLFRMNSSGTLTTLHSFTGGDGFLPKGGLIQGSDGNFYGTTNVGGVNDIGTVFKMDSSGTLTTLHSFGGSDGTFPNFCRLVEGNDGNFYGTTSAGGLGGTGYGTVFRITPSGALTSLHSFAVIDGASPSAGLTKGSDGNFYGLTFDGGPSSAGTVFKITPAGTLTTLHFFAGSDGRFPFGTVIEGSDGNFYGTTNEGGASGPGTVFKMDPSGAVTTLHSFTGPDGSQPYGGLIEGSDGNFYGTTTIGGEGFDASSGPGTVFKITPTGTFTSLLTFAGIDGKLPFGELTRGSDGNFYGTTLSGGASFNPATFTNGFGTIFKMTPAGALTTLHSFAGNAGNDGASPYGGPIQASDGSFYGTTEGGGPSFVGVAYRIAAPTVQPISAVSRKTHGSAGTFDVDLPLTGDPGIECRQGQGANSDAHEVVVTFTAPAAVASATCDGTPATTSTSGSDISVNCSGVPKAKVITVALTGVTVGASSGNVTVSLGVLLGDTTADGALNSSDISEAKSQSGQVATPSNFRADVTTNGVINSSDISLVKSKSGTGLP